MMLNQASLPQHKLAIGIQTFAKIREEGHDYVDKTGMAVDLVHAGTAYFLSCPRGFGKSLFLGTLKELYADQCHNQGEPIHQTGVDFCRASRNCGV